MRLFGTEPSFYTRKAHLSLRLVGADFTDCLKTLANKAEVEAAVGGYHRFPVLDCGDGSWEVDSTRIGEALSDRFPARALVPADPALAILAAIADDWFDEWFLRAAILFRARSAATRAFVARVGAMNLLGLRQGEEPSPDQEAMIARLVPGIESFFIRACETNAVAGPGIEATQALLTRSCAILETALKPFLFGGRPALADASLWGFLDSGLLWEPEARAFTQASAPHLVRWQALLRDGAHAEGGTWDSLETASARLAPLLAGDALGFAPFLAGNRQALRQGTGRLVVDGVEVPARGFTEKCRAAIGARIAALSRADRARFDAATRDWPLAALYAAP